MLLYKVLLEIGKVTGSFSITTDEYKYLVATTKNYKDFLDTLLLIKLSRENNWDGYDISSLRSKFDNRMLQALKQLPTLEITSSSISITKDKETEVAEKVYYFENELLDYEIDDYISFLGSTKSLFNVKKSEKKNINNDMETLFKEYLQLQQYQPNDVIKFVGRLKSGKRLAELVGIDPDVSAYDYKKLEDYIEFYEQAIGASNFDEINKSTSGELKSALDAYKRCLEYKESLPYNRIYFGAPGTGKSYGVSKLIKQLYPDFDFEDSDGSKFVFRTTFHPEYTYSDFVGQVMPVVKSNGDISYDFTPGVFTRALQQALDLPTKKVFLVLEELSRANVAAVFGDLFQLLDRNEEGNSEYGITNHLIAKEVYHAGDVVDSTGTINAEEVKLVNKKIKLPSNLIILATVNTNDQNVFAMDTAFKRRFEWEYVSIDPVKDKNGELLNNEIVKIPSANGLESMTWCKFYPLLNDYITSDMELSEDKQIGQFFIKFVKDNDKKNQVEVLNKLLQYLWEDVNNMAFKSKLFTTEIKSFGKLYSSWKDALENDAKVNIFDKSFYDKLGVKGENKVEEVEVPEVDNNSFEEEEDNEERD